MRCYGENKCSTNFPSPANLAASFNKTLWRLKGATMSDEFRAYNNLNWHRFSGLLMLIKLDEKIKCGLSGYGPNINILRDPRFGRNSEVPSEDPYLAGTYAAEMV
jgi:beta-D-xylosidase 4